MTSNPYDELAAHDVDDVPHRAPRLVSLRVALIGCLLSAVAGGGATWAVLTATASPAAIAVHLPTDHDLPSQSPRGLNERKHP